MVTSKLCDCGTMNRVECMCDEFESLVERDAWLEDQPDIEDVDYEWGESVRDADGYKWQEYDGGDDGK